MREKMKMDREKSLIEQAFIFSFPLVLMDITKEVSTNATEPTKSKAHVNQFFHAKTLATSEFRQVVTPNVDTLYSQVFFDLKDDALVIRKPYADRYLTFQIMDAWSNTVAILGTGGDTDEEKTYILTGPSFRGDIPNGMDRIEVPTSIGWLIGRTICYGTEDIPNIYKLQNDMDAKTLSVFLSNGEMSKGSDDENKDGVPIALAMKLSPTEYFERFNKLLIDNPSYPEDNELLMEFADLGIGAGLCFSPSLSSEDLESFWCEMKKLLIPKLTKETLGFMVKNGNFKFYGHPISHFGKEYGYRCLIAIAGFGANPVETAVYLKAEDDDSGEKLSAKNKYLLHFMPNSLPPVGEHGFWSVTAYGDDNFLISNPLNRYAISNRSNFKLNEDNSLDLILKTEEPNDNKGNWLPVGNGGFHLFLRIYRPDNSVLNGIWEAPKITKID
ncbi:DUF1254 domain-containing protein [Peptostreptococcus stomatis]|uniref:DUF1254 domain-containing protein n=1 Tax=Peptostreptococcus stomatis TaxID=341694 RepID=UPI00399165E4